MGQSASTATLPSADPRVPYFAVTFQSPDKISLALADQEIINMTRQAILDSVSAEESGNKDTFIHCEGRTDMNAYEFKFRGYPFMRGCSQSYQTRSKRMCCFMLELYEAHGWKLTLASDLSRSKEVTTWFFRRDNILQNGSDKEKKTVLCLSVSAGDTIQLINGNEKTRRLLAKAMKDMYEDGIKCETLDYDGDYQIELADEPWLSHDPMVALKVRQLLLEVIRSFEIDGGFKFYGTVNTKGTSDSLFFVEDGDVPETEHAYFSISLNCGGRITVIDAPSDDVVDAVLRAVVRFWPGKLHSQTVLDDKGTHEFRLKGNPWYETSGDEATAARIFICGLLETLHTEGYEPITALDVTRGLNDKALFIFRSTNSAHFERTPQQKAAFLLLNHSSKPYWCISLQDESKIRLIGAPEGVHLAVRHAIDQIWPWGIQKENSYYKNEGYVFKLKSGSWGAEHHQNTAALMTYILKVLNDQGCKAVLSADVTGRYISNNHGGSHSLDVHSWFLTTDHSLAKNRRASGVPILSVNIQVPKGANQNQIVARKDDEEQDELPALKSMGSKKERPMRKVSAVEYSSYVVNAVQAVKNSKEKEAQSEAIMKKNGSIKIAVQRRGSAFSLSSNTKDSQ